MIKLIFVFYRILKFQSNIFIILGAKLEKKLDIFFLLVTWPIWCMASNCYEL